MDLKKKHRVSKVYCSKCDQIFESREQFERHVNTHSSGIECETCPIDAVISKIMGLFRRRSQNNLE